MKNAAPNTDFLRWLGIASWLGLAAFVWFYGVYKLSDVDLWWHIKAGELMAQTRSLIDFEPFAHTIEGQPYGARFEWLFQVIVYVIHRAGGDAGVIWMRLMLFGATLVLLLSVDPKRVWPNVFVAILAAVAARPGLVERPQMFSYAFFAGFFLLSAKWGEEGISPRTRHILIAMATLIQVLWVNLHGAVALAAFFVTGPLLIEEIISRSPHMRWTFLLNAVLFGALFVSPDGWWSFSYVFRLNRDAAYTLIGEWRPREFSIYIRNLGPLWVLALASFAISRSRRIFCAGVLAITGFLSTRALRHEMFFDWAVVGSVALLLKHSPWWRRGIEKITSKPGAASAVTLAIGLLLFFHAKRSYADYALRDGLRGWGANVPARNAYDFIERENIRGTMFNSDALGGYLMYRGHPDRKIFIDGRNWDYGPELVMETFRASFDAGAWEKLERAFGLSYAVIYYNGSDDRTNFPGVMVLGKHPGWALVFLDDQCAVYVKRQSLNQNLISKKELKILTPEKLEDPAWVASFSEAEASRLREEINQVLSDSPEHSKTLLVKGALHVRLEQYGEAEKIYLDLEMQKPHLPRVWAQHAALKVKLGDWRQAGELFDHMVKKAGRSYPNINYQYIAGVWEKAGNASKSEFYRRRMQ
ncbi:MAG: hypothetical protein KCHDKBKB_02003 [Elusimicrobia bacterium]|nr:hypothetical protein [Elusimicrobiota bacterium]